jgi:hypothetical protein
LPAVIIACVAIGYLFHANLGHWIVPHKIIWDGSFNLSVRLTSKSEDRIVRVAGRAISCPEEVEEQEVGSDRRWLRQHQVAWKPGKPFTVLVPCSGRETLFAWFVKEESYSQMRLLLIRVEYDDGRLEEVLVDVPHRPRGPATVTVNVP